MRVRIETDTELTPEETTAVRAALEQYAATSDDTVTAPDDPAPWAKVGRTRALRGEGTRRTGGRDEWQAARDRRRRAREAAT